MKNMYRACEVATMKENGLFPAMCCGLNYTSGTHHDCDMGYTAMSCSVPMAVNCTSKPHQQFEQQSFLLTEYHLKFDLHNGGIVIFNPYVQHASVNPEEVGTFLYSAYIKRNTVLACAANAYGIP